MRPYGLLVEGLAEIAGYLLAASSLAGAGVDPEGRRAHPRHDAALGARRRGRAGSSRSERSLPPWPSRPTWPGAWALLALELAGASTRCRTGSCPCSSPTRRRPCASGLLVFTIALLDELRHGRHTGGAAAPSVRATEDADHARQGRLSAVPCDRLGLSLHRLDTRAVRHSGLRGLDSVSRWASSASSRCWRKVSAPAGPVLATSIWQSLNSWDLTALPMFIWMGEILYRTKLSEDMFEGLAPWLSRLPGRLLHVNVLGCAIFAAVSGSSAATCATIGRISHARADEARLRRAHGDRHAGRLRHAGPADPAVDHHDRLCGGDRPVDRAPVHRRRRPGHAAGRRCSWATSSSGRCSTAPRCRRPIRRPASPIAWWPRGA